MELTPRELEILQLMAQDFTNIQIADKLFISTKTVEDHKRNAKLKLGLPSILALSNWAARRWQEDLAMGNDRKFREIREALREAEQRTLLRVSMTVRPLSYDGIISIFWGRFKELAKTLGKECPH